MKARFLLGRFRPLPGFFLGMILTLLATPGVQAGEAFYVLMFGSQRTPTEPNYSHSFATFVRATWEGEGPCPESPTVEAHTISWLPRNGIVRAWALHPECGRNFGLQETLEWAYANEMRVSMWGAYEITPELYEKALKQLELLESGQVMYKADDVGHRTDRVSNCIHAVSSIVGGYRVRVGIPGWGQTASYVIMRRFLPWVINSEEVHPWVSTALRLDDYPIIYRELEPPLSGGIIGPINRVLGGERGLRPTYGRP